jgi:hypothetical protein
MEPMDQQDKDELERVQKRAVGMVLGLKETTYDEKL